MDALTKTAHISPCGTYRYNLTRDWGEGLGRVCWIMLNPSTADADVDDPTIRRCIGFTERWGYGGMEVVNLYALRATNPEELKNHPDPIPLMTGLSEVARAVGRCDLTICAWGVHGGHKNRGPAAARILRTPGNLLYTLRLTKDGHPAHPLYLPSHLKPFVWEP